MKLPVLYALSSTGKIKQWSIGVEVRKGIPYICVEHGYVDGKKQLDEKPIKEGKNIGKANETTPLQQAELQAKSKWNKQKDSNYVEDQKVLKETDTRKSKVLNLLPMLAHPYEKKKHTVKWPQFCQPKLNGVRCIARKVSETKILFTSRKGKVFKAMEGSPLELELLGLMKVNGTPMDGELFNPDYSFEEIGSAVKTEQDSEDFDLALRDGMQYWIYDVLDPDKSFAQRNEFIDKLFYNKKFEHLVQVETIVVKDERQFLLEHARFSKKYEGSILRDSSGLYKLGHRSSTLLKHKDFIDEEFTITGFKEATGRDAGTVVFLCKNNKNDNEFDVRPKGSHAYRTKLFKKGKQLIGKQLTVKYQNLSEDKQVPIFPVGLAIRDYE